MGDSLWGVDEVTASYFLEATSLKLFNKLCYIIHFCLWIRERAYKLSC